MRRGVPPAPVVEHGAGREQRRVGELVSVHVIPRPHANLEDALPIGKATAANAKS